MGRVFKLRRLEDRIRELCARAVSAPAQERERTLAELQSSIRALTQRLRRTAAAKLLRLEKGHPERRSA
jgi:hypothetical protein